MNLLGKIFTGVILIASCMFLMLAVAVFAAHKNWKEVVTNPENGLTSQLAAAKQVNIDLRAEMVRLKQALQIERAARVGALAALESKLVQVQQQLDQKEIDLATRTSALSVANDTMQTMENTLVGLTNEVVVLRSEIRSAQQERDQIFNNVVSLTDDLNQATNLNSTLEERGSQLTAQITRQKSVMDKIGVNEFTPVAHIPPKLDGVIQGVGEKNFVQISLGFDDGLRVDHQLEVFSSTSGNYLGRLRVVKTAPDASVAEVLKKFQRGIPIKKGDSVRTKIK